MAKSETTEKTISAGRSDKRHYAMKRIRPIATQACMYFAVAGGAVYFAANGGSKADIILAIVLCLGAGVYTLFYGWRFSKTYYSIRNKYLIVSTPKRTQRIGWEEIDDASSKSIELVLKNGTSIPVDQYDDLRVLTQGLDMRGVRLEYKRMSTTIMDEQSL